MGTFDDLPDEILQQVLFYVAPEDTLANLQLTSRRFHRLGNEKLLWRYHCRTSFRYWDSKHRIGLKFAGSASDVNWKKIYFYRQNVECQTTETLDGILAGQIKRIEKYENISQYGYDAKDTLLRHCQTDEDAVDVLARRFYSNAVLDHVHRSKALEEWWRLGRGESIALERALGAFDMFVLHNEHGDLDEISELINRIVAQLRMEHPDVDFLPPRRKASLAVKFLRSNNLVGLTSELQYRDLQNNYIGIALQDPNHPSLPLISVAIFCAVAQRLGVKAHALAFPNHVHAIIYPEESTPSSSSHTLGSNPIYFDPYRSDEEIPVEHLRALLVQWGVGSADFHRILESSENRTIVLRTSRNILTTVHEFRGVGGGTENTEHPTIRLHANPFADMDNAFYSALWANFMLCSPAEQLQFLPMILERFERLYPMDASLIEGYVCPPFRNVPPVDQWELLETLRVVRTTDAMPKQIRSRNALESTDRVKYYVGQVFQHRRYTYTAVIIGWDVECRQNSQWMAQNSIDALDKGRHQSFYHALVEDTSIRYVAEENVEITEPEVPVSLMSLAGRYFKRWDKERHRFVSNLKDEYPDD